MFFAPFLAQELCTSWELDLILYAMQRDPVGAKAEFSRVLDVAVCVALAIGTVVGLLRFVLPKLFTSDAAVIAMAGTHLPILAFTLVSLLLVLHVTEACAGWYVHTGTIPPDVYAG